METIARIVTRYSEFERLYLQGTKSELEMMLQEALTRLYAKILIHLARAVRFFGEKSMSEFQLSNVLMFSWKTLLSNALLRILTIKWSSCQN